MDQFVDSATAVSPGQQCDPHSQAAQLKDVQLKDAQLKEALLHLSTHDQLTGLPLAPGEQQLQLLYQPIVDLRSGAVSALEAMLYWDHPQFGTVDADRFIGIADAAGLPGAIGPWLLERACGDLAAWRDAGLTPLALAFSLSSRQFHDHDLPGNIANALSAHGLQPGQLMLQVAEAAVLDNPEASARVLGLLKALGIGLTLHQFGEVGSSLTILKRFPIDCIKIDPALVSQIVCKAQDEALVKTVIAMAHHLGLQVGACGIDTENQCALLRRSMCDYVQGGFTGAPIAADAVADLLRAPPTLPAHLLRVQQRQRTLLLVDDEPNIISALKRLLRRDQYTVLSANSGQEGLEVLAQHPVDVIVSDQRMPGMLGVDFLRAAKALYPDTIRIMLSGYTELQSVTDAVNEGAIYKFLTKPWEDDLLRGHIADAFQVKGIADENERLNAELRTVNQELASTNRKLAELLMLQTRQITLDEINLNVARELLQLLPLAVIGLDDEGIIAFVNDAADTLLMPFGALLGNEAGQVLPELFPGGAAPVGKHRVTLDGQAYDVVARPMGASSASRGSLITICRTEETP